MGVQAPLSTDCWLDSSSESICNGPAKSFAFLPKENHAIFQASRRDKAIKAMGLWAKHPFPLNLPPAEFQKDFFFLLSSAALTLSTLKYQCYDTE